MIDRIYSLIFLIMVTLVTVFGQITSAQTSESGDVPVPLVLVNGDTLTTYDLRLELNIMVKMSPQTEKIIFSEPGKVLRRLIQNQLILQEGYRLELDKSFSVSNQVLELVRHKGMVTLLDSVSLSVTADTTNLVEARRKAVHSYIIGLIETYQVSIDSTLLKSLDFASADPEVQKYLKDSPDVLATVPTGKLTVAKFSRVVRFTEFHGLEGKPNAAERRDKIFDEWITEAVLNYQVKIQGLDQVHNIQEAARNLEHILIRQETLKILLQSSYEPQEDEIKQFYEENIAIFMLPSRVRMKSKKLNTEETAQAFREKLIKGANIEWLAKNDSDVVPGADPFPYDWFRPEKLGLETEGLKAGHIPEPYGVPGGWVVAVVSEIEEPAPVPLDGCRAKIIPMLKSNNRKKVMTDIMTRLENASDIDILPGVDNVVQRILEEMN